jgi:hypothetical protein
VAVPVSRSFVDLGRERDIEQLRRVALAQQIQIEQLLRVLKLKTKELEPVIGLGKRAGRSSRATLTTPGRCDASPRRARFLTASATTNQRGWCARRSGHRPRWLSNARESATYQFRTAASQRGYADYRIRRVRGCTPPCVPSRIRTRGTAGRRQAFAGSHAGRRPSEPIGRSTSSSERM